MDISTIRLVTLFVKDYGVLGVRGYYGKSAHVGIVRDFICAF